MKKTIVAVGIFAMTTACGGEAGGGEAKNDARTANSAAADHDQAVPTAAAEENHGHEHDGTQAENHAH